VSVEQRTPQAIDPPRHTYLGASEIAAALGLSAVEHPTAVWAAKTGRRKEGPPNKDMLRGIYLEPIVRNHCVAEDTRITQVFDARGFWRGRESPYVGAHDDGAFVGFGRQEMSYLEIKCPNRFTYEQHKEEGLPNQNILQLTLGMHLAGEAFGAFAVHSADSWETLIFPLELDEELGAWLEHQGHLWWERFVLTDSPPPDHPVQTMPEIPVVRGEAIYREDDEWRDLMEQWDLYDQTKKQIEELWEGKKISKDEREPGLRDRILEEMGEAKTIITSGYKTHQILQEGRKTFSTDLLLKVGPYDPAAAAAVVDDVLHTRGRDDACLASAAWLQVGGRDCDYDRQVDTMVPFMSSGNRNRGSPGLLGKKVPGRRTARLGRGCFHAYVVSLQNIPKPLDKRP
jgi:predicted phage-related endonuclease